MATQMVSTRTPQRRDDLTFTARDEGGRLSNWLPGERTSEAKWSDGLERGRARFNEVDKLAEHDEHEAFNAIRFALTTPTWCPGWGEEAGFADSLAAAAIIGMYAVREGLVPAFDKDSAERFSLDMQLHLAQQRIAELEARLGA